MTQIFEPDGWDARLRVGLLVPDGDVGPESEWSAITPPGVSVNASRFRFPVTAVQAAAEVFGPTPQTIALLAAIGVAEEEEEGEEEEEEEGGPSSGR